MNSPTVCQCRCCTLLLLFYLSAIFFYPIFFHIWSNQNKGLLWREILEFRDALPPSPEFQSNAGGGGNSSSAGEVLTAISVTRVERPGERLDEEGKPKSLERTEERVSGLSRHRVTSGLRRYGDVNGDSDGGGGGGGDDAQLMCRSML